MPHRARTPPLGSLMDWLSVVPWSGLGWGGLSRDGSDWKSFRK